MNSKSVLITSTGRSGTTFLIILYTILGFYTGYSVDEIPRCLYTKCNSGMERDIQDIGKFSVIKNPIFLKNMAKINSNYIHTVVIPIRNFERSAKSREYYKNFEGGLIDNATNYKEQIVIYNDYIATFIQQMVLHELPTIFIDFEKMIKDPVYLYNKLLPTFSVQNKLTITQDFFNNCYKLSSQLQSKRTPIKI